MSAEGIRTFDPKLGKLGVSRSTESKEFTW